jgi:hypothetical protein
MQRANTKAKADEEEAWEVEIEAVKNIKAGKVEMVTQSSKELLAELKDLENEP